jgi:hypothetical protein
MSRPQQRQGENSKMATFTIDTENNIAAHAAVPTNLDNLQAFAAEKELAKLSAEWPGSRLLEVWNSFAGIAPFTELKPVKKFTNRKAAVARIWAAVQRLSPDVAEPAADERREFELHKWQHEPDSERGTSVPRIARCA